MPTPSTPIAAGGASIPLESLTFILAEATRWRILAELSLGEPRMVVELARKLGRTPTNISKHLTVLRDAGLVVAGSGRLYRIADAFRPATGQREIDFGVCLLRLDHVG